MTKKEIAGRNIGMTFDLLRQIIDHPEIADTIANGAELDFIDKDMPVIKGKETAKGKVARYKVEHVFEPIKG